MKKTLAIMLLAVKGICSAVPSKAEFKFGPRIGLNVNKLSFNKNLFDGSNRCGFTGGIQAEYMLPMISLGLDLSLMYSYMDYDVDEAVPGGTYMEDFGKHFLEIPLNIKYKIGIPVVKKLFSPYVFTGPAVAFRLDKAKDNGMVTKTSQWVWNIGLGLEFVNHLQIGACYGFGMNNIVDGMKIAGQEISAGDLKARTNYWTVTAAWLF